MTLPIDPAEYPGTPEYQEELEIRRRKSLARRWAALEDAKEDFLVHRK